MSYGGDGERAVTRLDFDMDDHFAKPDILSAMSFERLGLLHGTAPEFDLQV